MTRLCMAFATALAGAFVLPAQTQELNAWDQRGAAPLPAFGEPKTRAEVIAELVDAQRAGWQLGSGQVSWFPEPALVARLAQRAEERVARRVQAERLATVHKQQVERLTPVGLRQSRPAFVLPGAIAPARETAAAQPVMPATTLPIRGDAAISVLPLVPQLPRQRTELPPLMVRDDRLDFRPLDQLQGPEPVRAELPAIEPPEAPAAAAERMPVSASADQG